MIIPLDKLLIYNDNKYILTKAIMQSVDKINNIKAYPDENRNWKVVPNILQMVINEDIKFEHKLDDEEK